MRRIILILLAMVPLYISAQNINDVYNISTSYYQGTAKSAAMGNAMGAVGQDFSSISINPAGLGLFRKHTFSYTPSIITTYTKSELSGELSTDSKIKFSNNSFGYVSINKSDKNVTNWAFGMNRTNNFNNSIFVNAYNENNSLIDAYLLEIAENGIYNDAELEQYSPSYIYPLWQTYLINLESDGGLSSPVPMGGLRQLKAVNSWGGTNEWTVSSSINFNDRIFLGLSINMPYVNSYKVNDYEEYFSTDTHNNYWFQEDIMSTTGWGVNGKAGIIAYLARWVRLGASVHTPTLYELTDYWRTQTVAHLEEYEIYEEFITPTAYFNYSMMTPWRLNGSAAFIFGNYGMLTADYEYVDYRQIMLAADDYDYTLYNIGIRNTFKPTMNLRVGTEWRYQNYCFRGGYSFYGSPYGIEETDYRRETLSCGFGFSQHFFTIDFAYVYAMQKHNYNLYSQYTAYYDMATDLTVNETTNMHNLLITFKFRLN